MTDRTQRRLGGRTLGRNFGRTFASALLALALPLPLASHAADKPKEVVSLCFEAQDVLPWRSEKGGGLNFELLKMVEQRLDIQFNYLSIPWKRCLAQLKANAVDGAFAVSYKRDRRELGEYPGGEKIDVGKRMHVDRYVVLRKKGSKVEWDGKSFRNLDGPIGFQLGYSVGDVLRAQNLEVDEGSQRAVELARKLIAGRVAAAAVGGSDAGGLMRGPLGPEMEQLPIPIIEKPYFLILSHAMVASRPELAERIWRAVEQARNSAAYKNWSGRKVSLIDTRRPATASDAAANAVLMRGRGPLARLRGAWRRNIFLRLGCGIFFALAVSTAIYTTYVMQTLRAEAEQNLRERAERLTAVLSRALARPLFDINSAAVSSVVDASGATPEVLVLRVLGPNGAEMASYVSPLREPVAAIHVRRDISFSDARRTYELGRIELAFSRQKMDEDLRRRIVDTVAANLLLALGIGLSIFLVARRAARPFSDIQAGLEKLTHGETDIKLSGIGREDQVGRMSEAVLRFRDTLTRLRDAERELRDLNADLEKRISERTRELTESMLMAEESEAKLQTIVDTALDAVVRMNPEGGIVGWNTQAERIFGWSRDEALGRELDQTIIPPRFRYDHHRGMRRHLSGGGGGVLDTRIEVFALRRNGEEFPIELSITKVGTDTHGGYEFCAFIRDISVRREREQKLVSANVMAEAANVAKSEFLANMSHEIRTPMSAVLGMAYLALRTEMTPKQHDYISKIHMAALSLLGIINDILDFSKIEAGRLELESIPFLLDDVLAHVSSVTAQRAADKQLDYVIDVAPQVPRYLVGDPLRLGQVLINLVNNAVKFTPAGSLELRCAPAAGAAAADGKARLCFSVRDTGIGMTPQQKGKLFRAFIQADGSTTRQYGGTGLGLSISQQLVRLMGGNIDVESQVDHGSTFRFEVELAVSDAAALAVRAAVYEGPVAELKLDASPRRTARVLLAEDSADNQDVTRELLALQGLDVEVVGNGQLAVERLLAAGPHAYDLVLMDLGMPLLDGYEATQLLRKDARFNELPVIAVTSHALADVRARCLANGMQDYVTKPIDPQRLYRVLSRWLGMSMKVVPPLPPRAEVQTVSEEDARRAVAELRVLLAEFSGESLDYFENVRASLAALLSPQTMGRLKHHMEQYEFEAAGRLLAAVADEDEE